jgi:hypothetical protein
MTTERTAEHCRRHDDQIAPFGSFERSPLRSSRQEFEAERGSLRRHETDEVDPQSARVRSARSYGVSQSPRHYLTKPFNLRELLARVRAVLRRFEKGGAASARNPERGRSAVTLPRLDTVARGSRLFRPAAAPPCDRATTAGGIRACHSREFDSPNQLPAGRS